MYPSIADALEELHTIMPTADMPMYQMGLNQYSIFYLDDTEGLNPTFLIDEVCMPEDLVWPFKDHIEQLLRKAWKGKGCKIEPKNLGDIDENTI